MTSHETSSPVPPGRTPPVPLLAVDDLSVAVSGPGRRPTVLVDGATFAVGSGEVFCIVGPSGSGKSTLMKAILGLCRFTSGVVRFDGQTAARPLDGTHMRLRRAAQAVFQNPVAALNPHDTLLDAIAEPLAPRGVAVAERRQRAIDLAGRMGLSADILARRPHQVSVGQCQRACLARALTTEPRLLFLDEPLSALDAVVQRQVADLLARVHRDTDATLVVISHDLRLVRRLGTRVAVVDRGRIVECEDVDRFFGEPRHPQSQALVESFNRREARRSALLQPEPSRATA